jgi:hypothetical protein
MMMKKYKMVVFTHAVEGLEKEFNDWYQNTHLKDICAIENFAAAQRYAFTMNITDGPDLAPHLAIYDIETDDIHGAIKAMNDFAASGRMPLPESMGKNIVGAVYEEHGARVEAQARRGA